MRGVVAWLSVGVLFLSSCESITPRPSVVALRDTEGLAATCTDEAPPSAEDCRSQGEQASVEMQKAGDPIREIGVAFGEVAAGGCRTVTWLVRYASGVRSEQPTEVCGGG